MGKESVRKNSEMLLLDAQGDGPWACVEHRRVASVAYHRGMKQMVSYCRTCDERFVPEPTPAVRVFVENIKVDGAHGWYPNERISNQSFLISIQATVSPSHANAASDAISDTVNYKRLVTVAHAVIKGKSRKLVETLANEIADKVLAFRGVNSVAVLIRKPEILKNGVPGVFIEKSSISLPQRG